MRIKMLKRRDYTPAKIRSVTYRYEAGRTYVVKREWGAEMVGAGEATEVRTPLRKPKA